MALSRRARGARGPGGGWPTLSRVQEVLSVPNEVAAELAGVGDGVLDALRDRLDCTIRLRGIPFASAVRMYGSSITSIIRTRTSRV